jgi:dipeptidyl aminopeptidase/acylaminoacyl peptidase
MASHDPSVEKTFRAAARSLVFILKALPATSGAIDRVTRAPVIERFTYSTPTGEGEADLYRPSSPGPHPGLVLTLGVVPAGVDHPQRARMGQALARSGFAALVHWSPAMRDVRLDPGDIGELASAYEALIEQPCVDPARSGMMGACVGGSFALMAAADPRIRDRLAFVSVYAPYSSMWTLARDVATASRVIDADREPWRTDPLVWKTYVRSLTERLDAGDAQRLRDAFQDRFAWNASKTVVIEAPTHPPIDPLGLSADGRAVLRLLTATDPEAVDLALDQLPSDMKALMTAMSPMTYLADIRAPLLVLLHDRRDHIIPVSESRRLWSALSGRPGASYTELGFQHLDPTKLSPLRLARELPKLYSAVFPLYRQTTA